MIDKRRTLLWTLALAALLAPTRLSGLRRDLPYNLDVDAPWYIEPALHVVTRGKLDAAPPSHPGATLLGPLTLVYAVEYQWGRLTERWKTGAEFEAAITNRPELVFVPARVLCGLVAVAVIPATALLALELGLAPPAALLAATLAGLSGIHWELAHMVRPDLLLTLFVLLALVFSVRSLAGGRRAAALAGAAVGLATASKWPGLLSAAGVGIAIACTATADERALRSRRAVALALIAAGALVFLGAYRWDFVWQPLPGLTEMALDMRDGHFFLRRLLLAAGAGLVFCGLAIACATPFARRAVAVAFDPRTWIAAGSGVAAFVAVSPMLLVDLDRVLHGLVWEARSQTITMHGSPGIGNLVAYLTGPLLTDFGAVGLIAGFAGLLTLARADRPRAAVVGVTFLAYLAFLSMGQVFTARYAAPLVPLLAIGTAELLVWMASAGRGARALALVLLAGALFVPARRIGDLERRLTLRHTRVQASEWFKTTVPIGRSVAVEEHSVQLCAHCYRLRTLGGLWRLKERPELVVTSSWVHGYYMQNAARFPEAAAAYTRVLADYEEIASFWPDPESADGPEIRVYRRKR
jgi:hypothetical protein